MVRRAVAGEVKCIVGYLAPHRGIDTFLIREAWSELGVWNCAWAATDDVSQARESPRRDKAAY